MRGIRLLEGRKGNGGKFRPEVCASAERSGASVGSEGNRLQNQPFRRHAYSSKDSSFGPTEKGRRIIMGGVHSDTTSTSRFPTWFTVSRGSFHTECLTGGASGLWAETGKRPPFLPVFMSCYEYMCVVGQTISTTKKKKRNARVKHHSIVCKSL